MGGLSILVFVTILGWSAGAFHCLSGTLRTLLIPEKVETGEMFLEPLNQLSLFPGSDHSKRTVTRRFSRIQTKSSKSPSIPVHLPKLSELIHEHRSTSSDSIKETSSEGKRKAPPIDSSPFMNKRSPLESCFASKVEIHEHVRKKTGLQRRQNHAKRSEKRIYQPQLPWKANYVTSRQTQRLIQKAASVRISKKLSSGKDVQFHMFHANAILRTLLHTPPEYCNEVNVVGALTLTAKQLRRIDNVLSSSRASKERSIPAIQSEMNIFRENMARATDVLCTLLSEKRFSFRQLANLSWSLAKVAQFMGQMDPNNKCFAELLERVDHLMAVIANELALMLSLSTVEEIEKNEKKLKTLRTRDPAIAELCMICYAYALCKPRARPAGWMWSPRDAKIPLIVGGRKEEHGGAVTFERNDAFETLEKSAERNSRTGEQSSISHSGDRASDCLELLFEEVATYFLRRTIVSNDTKTHGGKWDNAFNRSVAFLNERTSYLLTECSWGELANIAWAYAHKGHTTNTSVHLMKVLVAEAVGRMELERHKGNSYSLKCDQDYFNKDRNTTRGECNEPLPRDLSLIAWSLGIQQMDNYRLVGDLEVLLTKIAERYVPDAIGPLNGTSVQSFSGWNAKDLVQLAVSMAQTGIDDQGILHGIFENAVRNVTSFQTWELCVLLWVQAKMYLTPKLGDQVFSSFTCSAVRCITQRFSVAEDRQRAAAESFDSSASTKNFLLETIGIGPQEQANLAWSLTVLEEYTADSAKLLQNIFHAASSAQTVMKLEHAHQLWQALFLLRGDFPDAVRNVEDDFSDWLEERWNDEKSRTKTSSARHRALSETLNLMRVAHYNEHEEDIDVAIVLKENSGWTHKSKIQLETSKYNLIQLKQKPGHRAKRSSRSGGGIEQGHRVAVEFDGPGHFTRNGKRALGHTVLKYRLLKRQGWNVVRVPYYEFDKIPFWASMERQRYLQRLLKTHANIRFSDVDGSEYKAMVPDRKTRFD